MVRQIRVRRGAYPVVDINSNPIDKKLLESTMKSIAETDKFVKEWERTRAVSIAKALEIMRAYQLREYTYDGVYAERIVPVGRQSTSIDPAELQKLVTEDEFLSCVKVSLDGAKKVLTGKQFAEIADVTEGKKGEETVSISFLAQRKVKK